MIVSHEYIMQRINELVTDPFGTVAVCIWETYEGDVRWNSGFIQVRRKGTDYWSLGVDALELLEQGVHIG